MANHSRRSVLRKGSAITLGTVGLAGCTGTESSGSNGGESSGSTSNGGTEGTAGSSDPTKGEDINLRIGSLYAKETTDTQMFYRFVDALEKKTDGRITGKVLPQTIGGGEDHLNATASGAIDMHAQTVVVMTTSYDPSYSFVLTPFIPQNWEHFVKMHDEYIMPMDGFNGELVKKANQRILGVGKYGLRSVTSNKPVKSPDDLSGVKMRVPQITAWTKVWKAIGTQATPVAYDELYQALQTDVVSASEGPIKQVFDANLYEVQSYFDLTHHVPTDSSVTINEDTWQSLSDADKELVQTTLDDQLQWLDQKVTAKASELRKKAQEEHDMTIVEDVDRQAFIEAAMPALKEMSADWQISYQQALDMA